MAGEVAKQQPRVAPVRTARSPKVDEYDSGKYEGEAKTKRTRAADSVDHEKSPYTDQFGNPPTPGSWDAILDAKRKARQADARARAGHPVEDVPSPYTDQFGNTPRPGSWDAILDAQWKANRADARARGGEEEDSPQYRYKSITGREYKYDLSKPLDRIRYRADAKAQIEDSIRNYVDPRAKIDEYGGQVGGGAK